MAYQLSDIITKVQQRVRDTGYSSTEITNYINDTQNDVFNEYKLPFMQASQDYTMTSGVSDITNGSGLPTNYVQAISLQLTTLGYEKELPYWDYNQVDQHYPDPEDTSIHPANIPVLWYYYNDTIRTYPKPNTAHTLTLRYIKRPTVLSGDSDVPEIPSEFEELLVEGAAYRVLQAKDNYNQAGVHKNKYDEILQKLVKRYSSAQSGHPVRMKINRSSNSKRYF